MMMCHGANLIPEGLEFGELTINNQLSVSNLDMLTVIAYSGDKIVQGDLTNNEGTTTEMAIDINQSAFVVNGIPSTVAFLICENGQNGLGQLLSWLNLENNSEYIVACFSVPRLAVSSFLTDDNLLAGSFGGIPLANIWVLQGNNALKEFIQSAVSYSLPSRPNSLNGYTPRNKKLLTYPYLYIGFKPQNGSQKIYRYENFNGTPNFKIYSELNPSPTVYFIPQNYKNKSGDTLEDIGTLSGYPTISSKTDVYNSWLAQNQGIIDLNMEQAKYDYMLSNVSNVENLLGSAATGNVGGAVSSLINVAGNQVNYDFAVKQQMAQIEKQSMLPDNITMSSSNATLLGYDLQKNDIFTIYTIKSQFAERIDKYFDMYGYLTNTVKVPNINNRPNWNYVKTIGAIITGDIPQMDLQQIKNMFDNGITLWHNTANFLDYSKNNR